MILKFRCITACWKYWTRNQSEGPGFANGTFLRRRTRTRCLLSRIVLNSESAQQSCYFQPKSLSCFCSKSSIRVSIVKLACEILSADFTLVRSKKTMIRNLRLPDHFHYNITARALASLAGVLRKCLVDSGSRTARWTWRMRRCSS